MEFRLLTWRWRFGNAILSKHPIREVNLLQLPSHAQWERWQVGHKQAVAAEIAFDEQPLLIVATHLEYRNESIRMESVRKILDKVGAKKNPQLSWVI